MGLAQVRDPLSGAIADQQRIFAHQPLRGDSADAAGTEELHQRDERMCRQKKQIAHGSNMSMPIDLRKNWPRGPFGRESTNSPTGKGRGARRADACRQNTTLSDALNCSVNSPQVKRLVPTTTVVVNESLLPAAISSAGKITWSVATSCCITSK